MPKKTKSYIEREGHILASEGLYEINGDIIYNDWENYSMKMNENPNMCHDETHKSLCVVVGRILSYPKSGKEEYDWFIRKWAPFGINDDGRSFNGLEIAVKNGRFSSKLMNIAKKIAKEFKEPTKVILN